MFCLFFFIDEIYIYIYNVRITNKTKSLQLWGCLGNSATTDSAMKTNLSNPKNMEIIKINTFIQQGYNKFVKNAVKAYIVILKNKSSYF